MDKLSANTNNLLAQVELLSAQAHQQVYRDSAWLCLYRAYLSLLAELAQHWQLPASLPLDARQLAQAVQQQQGHSLQLQLLTRWSEQADSWVAVLKANFSRLMNPPRSDSIKLSQRSIDSEAELQNCREQLERFIDNWRQISFEA